MYAVVVEGSFFSEFCKERVEGRSLVEAPVSAQCGFIELLVFGELFTRRVGHTLAFVGSWLCGYVLSHNRSPVKYLGLFHCEDSCCFSFHIRLCPNFLRLLGLGNGTEASPRGLAEGMNRLRKLGFRGETFLQRTSRVCKDTLA